MDRKALSVIACNDVIVGSLVGDGQIGELLPIGLKWRAVLHIDPAREPERARKAWESHLSRATSMTEHGYEDLLRSRPTH